MHRVVAKQPEVCNVLSFLRRCREVFFLIVVVIILRAGLGIAFVRFRRRAEGAGFAGPEKGSSRAIKVEQEGLIRADVARLVRDALACARTCDISPDSSAHVKSFSDKVRSKGEVQDGDAPT